MPDYQLGKIYKLICYTTNLVYIGSTCQSTLARRLAGHRCAYKRFLENNKNDFITSFKVLENDNYDIVLIEQCPCDSKDELHKKERSYIESIECVNKTIPTRNLKEYLIDNKIKIQKYIKEYQKEYCESNKEKIKKHKKEYYNENKERKKEYYETNKEKIKEHRKEYYNNNKEKIKQYTEQIKEKMKNNFDCVCGSSCRINEKPRHIKSLKHIKYCQTIN
jgi:molecular chaperone DnaK (HSP70)